MKGERFCHMLFVTFLSAQNHYFPLFGAYM